MIISQKGKLKFDLPKTQTEKKLQLNLDWDKKEDQNILTFAEIRSLDHENIMKSHQKNKWENFWQ